MKALLLKGLLYIAKTVLADVIRKQLAKAGKDEATANITAQVAEAKLDTLAKLIK